MKQNSCQSILRRHVLLIGTIFLLAVPLEGICGSADGGFWWKSNTLPYDTKFSYFFDVAVYPQGIFLDDQSHCFTYVTAENKHVKYNGIPYGVETVTAYYNNNENGGFVLLWNYDDTNRFTNAWIDGDSDVKGGWTLSELGTEGYLTMETNGGGTVQNFLRVQEQTVFISETNSPVQSTWENRYYFYNFSSHRWDEKMQDTFIIPASRAAVRTATYQTGGGEWAGILETSGNANDVDHGTPPIKEACYQNRSVEVVDQGITNSSPINSSINDWEAAVPPYELLYLSQTNYDQFVLGWDGADPFITTNPESTLVASGGTATLTTAAIGASSLSYQWYKNGVAILGATNTTYTTPVLSSSDSGNHYNVTVSDGNSSMTSVPATVVVAKNQVIGWGETNSGALDFPASMTNIAAIAAGPDFSVALNTNGTVVAWGDNCAGQTNVPTGLTNVTQISAGYYHSLALKNNGTVTAWGANYWGISDTPAQVSLRNSHIVAVAAGGEQSLALRSDGTVVAWGDTCSSDGSPAIVPKGLSGVVAIAAGQAHSLALKNNGTVVAWGDNYYGQSSVPAGLTNVVAISAGNCYSLALLKNGTVVGWGDDTLGETDVPPGLKNVVSISAGSAWCSLAMKSDGSVVSWGMAGTETLAPPSNSIQLRSISAGGYFALAIQTASATNVAEASRLHKLRK